MSGSPEDGADAPTLAADLIAFQAPTVAYVFIGLLTFTTYWLGGHMREQVCIYMCPWPRIQGAMLDEDSLVVSYRDDRGEPRGPMKKLTAEGKPFGDCIDCKQCVVACPMGIDIRDGQQLECIGCALCIDACNDVMGRIGKPRGLIAYDTIGNQERRRRGQPLRLRLLRPRTLLYLAVLLLVGGVMTFAFATRSDLELNLLRDRNPLFVTLSDGSIRNGYTLKILNKDNSPRRFALAVEGLPGAVVTLGADADPAAIEAPADKVLALRVFVAAPRDGLDGESTDIEFLLTGPDGRVVDLPRLLAFLEHALDGALLDLHHEARDAGPQRQREDIRGLERLLEVVLEGLGDPGPVDEAGDVAVHRESAQGQRAVGRLQVTVGGLLVAELQLVEDMGRERAQDLVHNVSSVECCAWASSSTRSLAARRSRAGSRFG